MNLETGDKRAQFKAYTGKWAGMTRTWFEPGKLADESPWSATFQTILGDRYLQYDYTGSLQGEPFEGRAIIGYNAMSDQFDMAWIDTFHQSTGIMYCRGAETATGFSVLGSYVVDDKGTAWGWRTVFEMIEPNRLTIRAYNITPGGEEHLGIETVYARQ